MIVIYKMQFYEMTLVFSYIPAILASVLLYFGTYTFEIIFILLSVAIIGAILPYSVKNYSKKRYSKKVTYNPLIKMVELHIDRTSSPTKLGTIVNQHIRVARQMNSNVLFYSNHFSEEQLRKRFHGKILIKKANIFQIILFYSLFWIVTIGMKKGKRFPLLRCEIICKTAI